jgi:4'-phosphopantetheinyl transferase
MTLMPENWTWNRPRLDSVRHLDFAADHPSVWQVTLTDDSNTLAHLTSLLSAEERCRLARFRLLADQRRFLIGRALLRIFVGNYLNLPAERVEFTHSAFGKPALVARTGAPALQFNVSHSGQLVLLAFHPAHEVGVDVEEVRPELDWKPIAMRGFPAHEYRRLLALIPKEGLTAFFQAWTRHEAGLKAVGLGFSDDEKTVPETRLACVDLQLPEGYRGAVATLCR